MTNTIYWAIVVLSFALSYANGANDAANALGTSYGADVTKLWVLLALGAIFELVGAVWCSSKVAGTLADKLLPTLIDQSEYVISRLMLGTCLAAFSFVLFSSLFGMPISGTHTVIGALIGAGLAGVTASSINWGKFGMTVASWFISPVLSSVLAGLLFTLICSTTLGGNVQATYWKMQSLTLIAASFFGFTCFMVISLAVQSPSSIVWEASVPSAFLLGLFGCRLAMTMYASEISQVKMTSCEILSSTVSVWSFDTILNREAKQEIDPMNFSESSHQSEDGEGFGGQYSLKKIYEINIVNFAYRILLIQAACLVCLAHGSNDVANSIAPLLVEFRIADTKAELGYWLGGIGISLGLITLGYKVMETVGKKVIKLDFYKGFACQFSTASCIMLGTYLGIPLSTTHCMIGSLFGIVVCNKMEVVKRAYNDIRCAVPFEMSEVNVEDTEKNFATIETPPKTVEEQSRLSQLVIRENDERRLTQLSIVEQDESSLNFATVKKILLFWGLTVPVAMGVSYGITMLLLINAP